VAAGRNDVVDVAPARRRGSASSGAANAAARGRATTSYRRGGAGGVVQRRPTARMNGGVQEGIQRGGNAAGRRAAVPRRAALPVLSRWLVKL